MRELGRARGLAQRGQILLCLALLAGPAMAQGAPEPADGAPLQLSMEPLQLRLMAALGRAGDQVLEAYERSPILVMGIALAVSLPLVAGIFAIGRAVRRRSPEHDRLAPRADEAPPPGDKAWISLDEGAQAQIVVFKGELLRIGRHSDNDIALEHEAIHRHHALIQRTPDGDFMLLDLTAGTGNQPLLNDQPVARALLQDGDKIILGTRVLSFHRGDVVPPAARQAAARAPRSQSIKEMTDVEREAGDRTSGRRTDAIETRRIGPAGRFAARGSDRSRA